MHQRALHGEIALQGLQRTGDEQRDEQADDGRRRHHSPTHRARVLQPANGLDDDPDTRKLVAATVAAGQVQKLAKHGVDTFHFYTMNRADLVFAISHLLGIRPKGAQKAA